MLIDFKQHQQQVFQNMIDQVRAQPQIYLNFETIADVYQAQWIKDLPHYCQWSVAGLDDGTGEFLLSLSCGEMQVVFAPY